MTIRYMTIIKNNTSKYTIKLTIVNIKYKIQ